MKSSLINMVLRSSKAVSQPSQLSIHHNICHRFLFRKIISGVTIAPAAPAGRGGAEHLGGAAAEHLGGARRALITLIF